MNNIWNIPNVLSMFRVLLILPLGIALWHQENVIAVMLGWLCGITDMLDGYLARRLNQISEFGKKIDPLADKLLAAVIVIILLTQSRVPVWFVALIWSRDLILLIGGLWFSKKLNWVIPSDWSGKLAHFTLGVTLMFIILNAEVISYWGIILTTTLLSYSFIHYIFRAIKFLKNRDKNNN